MQLHSFRDAFAPLVTEIDAQLLAYLDTWNQPESHYNLIRYHLGFVDEEFRPKTTQRSRGKRLRPLLCTLVGRSVGASPPALATLVLAAECMHAASLAHDDIQDRDTMRWGGSTVWALFGIGHGINVGDALIGHCYERLLALRENGVPDTAVLRVLEAFNRTHIRMTEGQHLDLCGTPTSHDVDDYLAMIERKTAVACECMTHTAAMLGQRDSHIEQGYRAFGHAFGMLYQICDDIHSVWSTTDTTGKCALGDLRERKASLPLIYGWSSSAKAVETALLHATTPDATVDDLSRLRDVLRAHGIDERCRRLAGRYLDLALGHLQSTGGMSIKNHQLESVTLAIASAAGVDATSQAVPDRSPTTPRIGGVQSKA